MDVKDFLVKIEKTCKMQAFLMLLAEPTGFEPAI
jgi:hypothetical protein